MKLYVGELQSLIGEKENQRFLNPNQANETKTVNQTESNQTKELSKAVNEMLFEWTKHSGTSKDPAEEELKKRKNREIFNSVKNDVANYLKTQSNNNVKIIKSEEGIYYAVHTKLHYIGELQSLIGEKEYHILHSY